VLGWHRELVQRRWAAYRGRPWTGRPPLAEAVWGGKSRSASGGSVVDMMKSA
jgi:hypothetical protein